MGYEKADYTEEFNERNERNEHGNKNKCHCAGKLCEALGDLENFAEYLCKKCEYDETHLLIELNKERTCVKVDVEVREHR